MIIVYIAESVSNSLDVLLEHDDAVPDPRIIGYYKGGYRFRFSVKGRILTITRIDVDEGWPIDFKLRAYLPTEDIPDFRSTVYTYHGLDGERAPEDVTEVIFHPSVTTIKYYTFYGCKSLVRVTIPDTVTRIEKKSFSHCDFLRFIRLSTNLEFIGMVAFQYCRSLQAVFLSPTVTHIGNRAFHGCKSLRFCILPDTIDHVGDHVFKRCNRLLTTVSNILSKVCCSTSVNPQSIQECIDTHGIGRATEVNNRQVTALHILCANPHVTGDCIRTYLQLAPEAAEQQDSDGMTPFQRLCRNDITFLEDRSFSSVMAFWYGGMPPLLETCKKRKRG